MPSSLELRNSVLQVRGPSACCAQIGRPRGCAPPDWIPQSQGRATVPGRAQRTYALVRRVKRAWPATGHTHNAQSRCSRTLASTQVRSPFSMVNKLVQCRRDDANPPAGRHCACLLRWHLLSEACTPAHGHAQPYRRPQVPMNRFGGPCKPGGARSRPQQGELGRGTTWSPLDTQSTNMENIFLDVPPCSVETCLGVLEFFSHVEFAKYDSDISDMIPDLILAHGDDILAARRHDVAKRPVFFSSSARQLQPLETKRRPKRFRCNAIQRPTGRETKQTYTVFSPPFFVTASAAFSYGLWCWLWCVRAAQYHAIRRRRRMVCAATNQRGKHACR